MTNITIILAKLEETLGTAEFDATFAIVKTMKAAEVAAIASKFVSKTAKSAPRRDSLQRIYARHISLVDSANKREWQRGKSAA